MDIKTLPPEERYVVQSMLDQSGSDLHADRHGGPLVYLGAEPVCEWRTVFSLLGKVVLRFDPETKYYLLTDDWRAPPKTKRTAQQAAS